MQRRHSLFLLLVICPSLPVSLLVSCFTFHISFPKGRYFVSQSHVPPSKHAPSDKHRKGHDTTGTHDTGIVAHSSLIAGSLRYSPRSLLRSTLASSCASSLVCSHSIDQPVSPVGSRPHSFVSLSFLSICIYSAFLLGRSGVGRHLRIESSRKASCRAVTAAIAALSPQKSSGRSSSSS